MTTELTDAQKTEIAAQLTGEPKFPSALAVSGLDLATNPYDRELVQRFVSMELVAFLTCSKPAGSSFRNRWASYTDRSLIPRLEIKRGLEIQ